MTSATMDHFLAGIPKPAEDVRGPRPPALVCRRCDATIAEAFDNPFLVLRKKLGHYEGDVTGGYALCDRCLQAAEEEKRNFELGINPSLDVIDCPKDELKSTIADYETTIETDPRVLRRALDWIDRRDRDFFLFGPTGTGKTRLAIAMGRAITQRSRGTIRVVYVRVPTLIRRLKAASFEKEHFPDALGKLDTYVNAGVLILDDLGSENGTPYTRTTIESLYTERLDDGRRTLITSNLPLGLDLLEQQRPAQERTYPAALGDYLGDDRMPSRIAGNAELVELKMADHRLGGWRRRR